MAIEVRELIIKVRIEEPTANTLSQVDLVDIKQAVLRECKKEIQKEIKKSKDR